MSWEIKTLGEIGKIYNGNSISAKIKKEKYSNLKEGVPFIATKDIDLQSHLIDYNNGILIPLNEPKFKIAKSDSILICAEGGSAGKKIAFLEKDVYFGNKLLALEPFKNINPKYVFYWYLTNDFSKNFSSKVTGLIGGISISNFKKLPIPLPPLDEQKRIVTQLDEAFEKIEKAKEDAQKNLENAKEIFQSELNALFENPKKHWEEKELGEICEKITDGSHNPPRGIEYSEFLMLSSRNIFNDLITFQNPRYLKEEDFIKENKRTQLKSGDILLTIVGTIGRVAVVPEKTPKFTLQRSVGVLKPNLILIKSKYLMYSLQSKLIDLNNNSRGVAQKGLYLNQIRNYKISFPPSLEEQQEIVEKLNALQEKTKQLEEVYEKKLSNLDELRQSILQRAFRGGGEE